MMNLDVRLVSVQDQLTEVGGLLGGEPAQSQAVADLQVQQPSPVPGLIEPCTSPAAMVKPTDMPCWQEASP